MLQQLLAWQYRVFHSVLFGGREILKIVYCFKHLKKIWSFPGISIKQVSYILDYDKRWNLLLEGGTVGLAFLVLVCPKRIYCLYMQVDFNL